jgi:hypothetical protein
MNLRRLASVDIWERAYCSIRKCFAEESFAGVRSVVGHSLLVRFMIPRRWEVFGWMTLMV